MLPELTSPSEFARQIYEGNIVPCIHGAPVFMNYDVGRVNYERHLSGLSLADVVSTGNHLNRASAVHAWNKIRWNLTRTSRI